MKKTPIIFAILFCAFCRHAAAAVCEDGYYLSDDVCTPCKDTELGPWYCKDDLRHPCPEVPSYAVIGSTLFEGTLVDQPYPWTASDYYIPSSIYYCNSSVYISTSSGIFFRDCRWADIDYFTECTGRRYYYTCHDGYYLSEYILTSFRDWYERCAACTNAKPANSHYSDQGTIDIGDCPWECDDGYGKTDTGLCAPLCDAGMTALRVGNLSIPLYADKDTSPSIHLSVGGTICYGSLESGGAANALNISYSGNTYHSVR